MPEVNGIIACGESVIHAADLGLGTSRKLGGRGTTDLSSRHVGHMPLIICTVECDVNHFVLLVSCR